ncbi:tRNA (adenosine(37)-N6)-threonylcarbamoyltransferase complex dimerization subunit type 1 TsaB [Mangrovivirga cuniculi]|uniref:tRNA (Adenosine(37)-N6)-threonylcarbamoyltransferase complex dimerization subunit type 1 TsaB n=1 Tax=Mangrovivirga cuniculi TaxID=2715131 RepID=A0A4D7JZ07_9BACT|nr:tRNA (adenosine(37)-N6)-threonylcarbamoyltransferase complex dimerization subunit type 1 TsaB [Mangrovivirga cuniculi]QCK13914.1 tRNA (adenosine(37)-N6)-threonylcarbamoyltransferase complex dimerization subunit type 1 TsaB [Mangrovivirga cuniculi]
MNILALETATNICSVAVVNEEKVLGKINLNIDRAHSSKLASAIKNLMELLSLDFEDLSAVAVSKGPGSYTGLRIGLSTAKGICYSNDIPLIGVETLQGMAANFQQFSESGKKFVSYPMIDARRMEVYTAAFDQNAQRKEDTKALIIEEDTFSDVDKDTDIYLYGDGAEKAISKITRKNVFLIKGIFPDATGIGLVAIDKFKLNQFEDVAYFEPFYLKEYKAGKPKSLLQNG